MSFVAGLGSPRARRGARSRRGMPRASRRAPRSGPSLSAGWKLSWSRKGAASTVVATSSAASGSTTRGEVAPCLTATEFARSKGGCIRGYSDPQVGSPRLLSIKVLPIATVCHQYIEAQAGRQLGASNWAELTRAVFLDAGDVGSEEVDAVPVEVAAGAVVVLGGAWVGVPGQDLGVS